MKFINDDKLSLFSYLNSSSKYSIISIYNNDLILEIQRYIKNNSSWEKSSVMILGDLEKSIKFQNYIFKTQRRGEIDKKLYFEDKLLEIKGYYVYRKQVAIIGVNKNNEQKQEYTYIQLYIQDYSNKNLVDIMEKIRMIDSDRVTIRYIKILYPMTKFHVIYKGPRRLLSDLKSIYIDTFFNKEKDRILKLITHTIDSNEHTRSGNRKIICFLLDGPSGSGKTSFVHRLGMYLQKNIIDMTFRHKGSLMTENRIYLSPLCHRGDSNIYLVENIEKIIEKCISATNENVDTVRINDIISFFKGEYCEKNSMILLATTRDLEKIKKICPRFINSTGTIVCRFGFADNASLQEMSNYYFKQNTSIQIPEKHNIAFSDIIDIIRNTGLVVDNNVIDKNISEKFKKFESDLLKLFETHNFNKIKS